MFGPWPKPRTGPRSRLEQQRFESQSGRGRWVSRSRDPGSLTEAGSPAAVSVRTRDKAVPNSTASPALVSASALPETRWPSALAPCLVDYGLPNFGAALPRSSVTVAAR